MKLVIPFLYNCGYTEIPDNDHKLLLTILKSYIMHGNTLPIIVAITHLSTKKLLDEFLFYENCGNLISYQVVDKYEVFNQNNYIGLADKKTPTSAHTFTSQENIYNAKVYCIKNIAKGDDIIICDTDMLFVKKVDWEKHIITNTGIQLFESYDGTTICSGTLKSFIFCVAKAHKMNFQTLLNEIRNISKNEIDFNILWPNGGLVYYSKDFRENRFEEEFERYRNSFWFEHHNIFGSDESFYVYLYANTDYFHVEKHSSLNVRVYSWANEEFHDPFNIPNTDMLHYCLPGNKPSDYQFTFEDGHIERDRDYEESIYDLSIYGTIWTEFYMRNACTRIILILWHYYYSYVGKIINSPNEKRHPPETFYNILTHYRDEYKEYEALANL